MDISNNNNNNTKFIKRHNAIRRLQRRWVMDQIDIDLSERWTRRNGSIALQRHLDRFRNEGA